MVLEEKLSGPQRAIWGDLEPEAPTRLQPFSIPQRLKLQGQDFSHISRRSGRKASLRKLGGMWLGKSEGMEEASTWEIHTGFSLPSGDPTAKREGRRGKGREGRQGRLLSKGTRRSIQDGCKGGEVVKWW